MGILSINLMGILYYMYVVSGAILEPEAVWKIKTIQGGIEIKYTHKQKIL
jgi:hypothetical protein